MNWYLAVFKKYAVFSGRARRMEFWMFILINAIVSFMVGFVEGLTGLAHHGVPGPISCIYSLAILVPSFAVGARRMHDTSHSGWWQLFPIVNLFFWAREGDNDANRFGPDPKLAAP